MAYKDYLGDSVYVEFDGFSIWLTTENGYPDDPRNKICLEPLICANLIDYMSRLKLELEANARVEAAQPGVADEAAGDGDGLEVRGCDDSAPGQEG